MKKQDTKQTDATNAVDIPLCDGVTEMITAYADGVAVQQRWGQGYATLLLGMACQMKATPQFTDWCGSGRGKGDARDQVNTAIKDAIETASDSRIKTASLSVAWKLGITAAQEDASMGFTFVDKADDGVNQIGSISVDIKKLRAWVNKGGVLQRPSPDEKPDWKKAKSRATALIASLEKLTVGDFPAGEDGQTALTEFNTLLEKLRAMDAMKNGIVTPAVVKKKVTKKTTKKRSTSKAA